jgi:hypothetical protein
MSREKQVLEIELRMLSKFDEVRLVHNSSMSGYTTAKKLFDFLVNNISRMQFQELSNLMKKELECEK